MLEQLKALLQRRDELLKENRELLKKVKCLEDEFSNIVLPFYYLDDEDISTDFKEFSDKLIEKGYLTNELDPTELSLKSGFIKYNDQSEGSKNSYLQPKLLITGKLILSLNSEIFSLPNKV